MNYVIFDLEWNQSSTGTEPETGDIPCEIIEIGAVKVNDKGVIIGEFNELVKPLVYHTMNSVTSKIIHIDMDELENERGFTEVAGLFLDWCGTEEYIFGTWGSSDLSVLQRNMEFHRMPPLSDGPIPYLDVQKLFSIAYEDGKARRSLESAADFLHLEKGDAFHRAFNDAKYTAQVFVNIMSADTAVLKNVSFDIFHVPKDRKSEVKIQFDSYAKFISREFEDKASALEDREVSSSKCYLCHRNIRRKVKWFTTNGRTYYCLAYCEIHGFLKGKIRIRKSGEGKVYVIKTTKLIDEEAAEEIKLLRRAARRMPPKSYK